MDVTDVTVTTETRLSTVADLNDTTFWSLYNDANSTSSSDEIFVPCYNTNYVLDEKTARKVVRLLSLTDIPTLDLFGVVTNVINCVVFVRHGLRDRINPCLFSLALSDVCFLLLIFFLQKFVGFLGLMDSDLSDYWIHRHMNTVLAPTLA